MALILLAESSMDSAEPSPAIDGLHATNQRALAVLLTTDLELAHTFVEVAEVTGNVEHRSATVGYARNALVSLRKLFRLVEDADARRDFEHRAGKLQKAIIQVEEKLGLTDPVSSSSAEPR